MDLLSKITIAECNKLSEAEVLFRNCPQDNLAGHSEAIKQKINEGTAKLFQVMKEGRESGFFVVEKNGCELYVLAMALTDICGAFENIVNPYITEIAKQSGCTRIAYSTVRPGLIKEGLSQGFILSEVVLRRYL